MRNLSETVEGPLSYSEPLIELEQFDGFSYRGI